MARQDQTRILGPYEDKSRKHKRWKLILIGAGGEKLPRRFSSEKLALEVKADLQALLAQEVGPTVGSAIKHYDRHLRDDRQNRTSSVSTTVTRLRGFFTEATMPVADLTETAGRRLYGDLRERVATDTHRNMLAESKTFVNWCVSNGWLAKNPLSRIEGQGRRQRGKAQLRIDEARKWLETAMKLGHQGEPGAIAAMMTLLMGMRAGEITDRVVRDLDDGGRLLWIDESKTSAGRRRLPVPNALQPMLVGLAEGRLGEAPLFGKPHGRGWPRYWVRRICLLAGVTAVTAHGMRGLHSTLAEEQGVTAHVVARALGHESSATTRAHYTQPDAVAVADQRRALQVLAGGRG